MYYVEPKNINEIIQYIQHTIARVDRNELSTSQGASNIVGATLANNSIDIDKLYDAVPYLEKLVELAADIEIYDDKQLSFDTHLKVSVAADWERIKSFTTNIKNSLHK
ncbi:hypothetical protein I8H83_05325 [Candidatus Saccharibacteria bacterium]|nr:hypothetical protein [Candidatus Saccharibacteria bacterium]MBH2007996.1 hypothetical protein [Candidatus Saccharibacteria bacterium]